MHRIISRKTISILVAFTVALSACQQAGPDSPAAQAPPAATAGQAATTTVEPPTATRQAATPRPPGNPVLVDREPVRGEELQPDKSLVLTFDQPMDRASVETAVAVIASDGAPVDGAFDWQRDNVVAFKPAQGWERAARYTVDLQDSAKSAKGLTLARPETFNLSTIGALEVAQTIPANDARDVGADSLITVLFNRPVVPLTGLAQQAALPKPVTFSPAIEGQGEWLNTSIYIFRPAQPLAAGSAYVGQVAAGLKDTTGAELQTGYQWTFTVAAPTVKAFTPDNNASDIDLRQPISVTFSQKMDRASAEAAFAIAPPVKGSFRWSDEPLPEPGGFSPRPQESDVAVGTSPQPVAASGEVMGFWPDEDYQRSTLYQVTIGQGAKAQSGDSALRAPAGFSFRSIELPGVASTVPFDGDDKADPTNGFTIHFTAPVLPELVVPNLTFEPAVSLTRVYTYYDSFEKRFYLNVDLKPSTQYKVTIGGAIADKHGAQIGQDTVVRFKTGPLTPYAVLRTDAPVGTYNAGQPTRLFAAYRNVSKLDFELASLTLKDFYRLTGGPDSYEVFRAYTPPAPQVIRKWSVKSKAALNEGYLYDVKLGEGGALEPGIYLLTLSAPEPAATDKNYTPARHILIVTDLHVALKLGEREALVWATDLNSGQPAAGLPVSFRNSAFDAVAEEQTDAEGKAFAKMERPVQLYDPFYALIGEPGQPGFGVGFNNWDQGLAPWDFNLANRYNGDPFNVYLYTDRPIYRPGQMVFYKGVARADDDARYSLIANLKTADVTISNDQGQQVFSVTVPLNALGTFTGSFALDNAASTGYYFINTCVPEPAQAAVGRAGKGTGLNAPAAGSGQPCRNYGVSFQVAAYRAPEYEVTVTPDKTDYQAGETMNATVNARYFFGGNVAGAKVEWALFARDYYFDRYTASGETSIPYSFGDYDAFYRGIGYNEQIANGRGQTDAAGNFVVTVPADLSQRKSSAVFSLEVSVTDLNDQSVSSRASAIVHKAPYYFGIAPEEYVGLAGEEARVHVISVDCQGQPLASQAGTVTFYQREWFTTQEEDAYGYRQYTSVPSDTEVSKVSVTTGADGKAAAAFTPTAGGEYYIKVTGGEGGPVAATYFYVSSNDQYVAWRVDNNDRIDLKADKQAYKVGETVKLLVPSPFSGTVNALVTVERGRFLSSQVVQLKSNSDILDIPVEAAYAPNAFVSVLIVKGVDESNNIPAFKLGYVGIQVDPGEFKLNVEIKPDKTVYAPRDTVTYDIRVTDAAGNPVQAELSLALVDKAVLSLADPNSPPIVDAFYGVRGLGIRTANSLSVNVDRVTAKIAAEYGKGGGGGGLASAMEGLFVRQNFKDTAYWEGVVNTDAQGNARVQVTLPDNLTTWVMDARAVTADTKVGQATNEILSTKSLLIRPVTPRFFVVGDSAVLGAVVNNNTDGDIEAEVSLAARGVSLGGDATQKVTVKASGSARVDWPVTVEDAPSAELTFTAKGGGLEDSSKPGLATAPNQGIPILHYVAPETVATAGDVSEPGQKREVVALPPRLDTGKSELDLQVDPSLAAVIRDTLATLEEYPYESTETTASRLLSSVALYGSGRPADASQYLQRLMNSQRSDGGWGWWTGDDSNTNVTAYVLLALARAQAAGYGVDANMLTRAREYVTNKLAAPSQLGTTGEANQQAAILFSLTESGAGDSGRLGALYENREKLGHYGRALLAMSLDKVQPGDARVKTLLNDLNSAAIASATGVSWQEKEYDWYNFDSSVRSTAIILNALARLDPKGALSSNVVRWLMVAREGKAWETSQENAWSVMALSEWRAAVGETDPSYTWRVTLNDEAAMNGTAAPGSGSSRLAVRAGGGEGPVLLTDQPNQLAFERGAGDGRMYYTAQLKAFLPADEVKALNRGIVIARKYESADCKPEPGQPCAAIDGAAIGQNVRVRLTIVAPNDLFFVRVTDPLPGGAEAVDTSLKTSQQIATETESPYFGGRYGWGWWWFSHTELRDDHAAVFASYLPAGTYEYTYLIRPSIAGTFKVMPSHIEQTYFPETFGRGDGATFTVTK